MYQRSARTLLPIYWLALAVGTHWPRLELPGQNAVIYGLDKWLHLLAYAGLVGLALAARLRLGRSASVRLLAAVGLIALYIPIDELTQRLVPGRSFDLWDLVASYLGLALGGGLWAFAHWLRRPAASFIDHARIMSGLTLVSRCFGLVRDWALAFALGFGAMFDAFAIAFLIPNLFRRLFGEGALAGAFVPHYSRLDQQDKRIAQQFASFVLRQLLGGLFIVALIGAFALFLTAELFEPFGPRGNSTLILTSITIWYAPLICAVAIIGAVLQVHGRFGVPSAMPVILNVVLIMTALMGYVLTPDRPQAITMMLAVAVVVAGLMQFVISREALRVARAKLETDLPSPATDSAGDPLVRQSAGQMMKQWVPTMLGLAVFQINTLADSLIAMFFSGPADTSMNMIDVKYPIEVGSVAILGAAARLYEFPLGVFGIAIATAIFPALSRLVGNREAFGDTLRQGLRLSMFIGLPASVGLIFVRGPLCGVIYHDVGAINAGDSGRIAWVLLGYASAIWAYSMNHVLTRAFYAQHEPQTPARLAMRLVVLNLVLNLTLIWPLGAAGLAWATAACQILQVLLLIRLARRHVDRPIDRLVWTSFTRSFAASIVMGAAVWFWVAMMHVRNAAWSRSVMVLGVAVVLGGGVFALMSWALKMPELRWVLARNTKQD